MFENQCFIYFYLVLLLLYSTGKHTNSDTRTIKDKPLWKHKGGGYCLGRDMSQAFLNDGGPWTDAWRVSISSADARKCRFEGCLGGQWVRTCDSRDEVVCRDWGKGQFLAWFTGSVSLLTLPDVENTGRDCLERKFHSVFEHTNFGVIGILVRST